MKERVPLTHWPVGEVSVGIKNFTLNVKLRCLFAIYTEMSGKQSERRAYLGIVNWTWSEGLGGEL